VKSYPGDGRNNWCCAPLHGLQNPENLDNIRFTGKIAPAVTPDRYLLPSWLKTATALSMPQAACVQHHASVAYRLREAAQPDRFGLDGRTFKHRQTRPQETLAEFLDHSRKVAASVMCWQSQKTSDSGSACWQG